MADKSEIVYSTEFGSMCSFCGLPAARCRGNAEPSPNAGDGIVRVRREIKGRGGKTVTMIYGLDLDEKGLQKMAGEMKRRFGTGGSVKDGVVLIQGDRCKAVIEWLEQKGYKVKRAGG